MIAGWDGWRGHLYRLAVRPERRREGVGRALLIAAQARLRALGGQRFDAMVLDDNELGSRFWLAEGYRRQGDWGRWIKTAEPTRPRARDHGCHPHPAEGVQADAGRPGLGMRLTAVTLDCDDVGRVALFWSALLGLPLREPLPGWRRLGPVAGGPLLTFQPVDQTPGSRAGVHVEMIGAHRHPDRKQGQALLTKLIASLSRGVPAALSELVTLGRTLKRRAADVLAYSGRPGTSNGPTKPINGRLEHLRGSALGFRNLTNYIVRSLLEAGGFRPRLHPRL